MGGGIIDETTGKIYEEFSNFFYEDPPILYDGKKWFFVESIYQALKTGDKTIQEEIRLERNISFVYQKGGIFAEISSKEKKKNMNLAIQAKMKNEKYQKLLLSTQGKLSGTDTTIFWRKVNGEIYEKIREGLRKELKRENRV